MAHDLKLEFVIPNTHPDQQVRAEKLVETLIDQVVPRMAESMSLSEDEVFARLLVELGHIIGITHAADSALSMVAMMTDAILQGQQAAVETACIDRPDSDKNHEDDDQWPDWAEQCSPVRH